MRIAYWSVPATSAVRVSPSPSSDMSPCCEPVSGRNSRPIVLPKVRRLSAGPQQCHEDAHKRQRTQQHAEEIGPVRRLVDLAQMLVSNLDFGDLLVAHLPTFPSITASTFASMRRSVASVS